MSEETQPAKKAARKTVRKKSATKRAPRKSSKSGSSEDQEKDLPLGEKTASEASIKDQRSSGKKDAVEPARKAREPKSGIRDARREVADGPILDEVSEKLVPDLDDSTGSEGKSGQKKQARKNDSSGALKEQSQVRQDSGEGRGRGRGRRERGGKREGKPRVTVDSMDLAEKAWKIFESEVTEEGLALLDDNGLRDYARSSFNAARLFLEEKERVISREKTVKSEKKEREQKGKVENDNPQKEEE
jgi:hypothetical protein